MRIMSAGMHAALIFGFEGQILYLGYRKRIDITPKAYDRLICLSPERCHCSRALCTGSLIGDAHLCKLFPYPFSSLEFLMSKLGILMKMSPQIYEPVLLFIYQSHYVHNFSLLIILKTGEAGPAIP